jgi:hypothetical protein
MLFHAEADDDMFSNLICILIQSVYADTLCTITSNTDDEDEIQSIFQLCNRILGKRKHEDKTMIL